MREQFRQLHIYLDIYLDGVLHFSLSYLGDMIPPLIGLVGDAPGLAVFGEVGISNPNVAIISALAIELIQLIISDSLAAWR